MGESKCGEPRAKHTKVLLGEAATNSISAMNSQQMCQFCVNFYRRNLMKISPTKSEQIIFQF